MFGQDDVHAALASFTVQHPESTQVVEDVWRHILTHLIDKKRAEDRPPKPVTPDALRELIAYALQPVLSKEEVWSNRRARLVQTLDDFRGFNRS